MIDLVNIKVMAGCGGDGAVSFFKLKNMRYGKPDGGDGGRGGSVFIESAGGVFDLEEYRGKKNWKAEDGENGGKNNKTGKEGKDLVLRVPGGTVVTVAGPVGRLLGRSFLRRQKSPPDGGASDSSKTCQVRRPPPANQLEELIFDFNQPGQKILVAEGGKGGRGNSHARFVLDKKGKRGEHWDSFNRAQKGAKGEEKEITLELKYLSQVGIIGLPNVGKSQLLSVLTSAHPKIADYPFTTLEPNLGILNPGVSRENHPWGVVRGVVVADIPGLIEGASKGKGLGFLFLRHIERTGLLIHVLDAGSTDLVADYQAVRNELKLYGKELDKKKEIVVVNKMDLVKEKPHFAKASWGKRKKVFMISAKGMMGIEELKKIMVELVRRGGE